MYSIKHDKEFVSNLRQVGIAEILLKVALNTIPLTPTLVIKGKGYINLFYISLKH